MIVITSKIDGFRRAGVAHSSSPTPYAEDRFTPAQLAKLRAEPNLVVQLLPKPKGLTAPAKTLEPAQATTETTAVPSATPVDDVAPPQPEGNVEPTVAVPSAAPEPSDKADKKGKGK